MTCDKWGIKYNESGISAREQMLVVDGGNLVKATVDAPYIIVAMPSRGSIPIEVLMAWKRIPLPINTITSFTYIRGLLSSVAREKLTHNAIGVGAKYIYFADDDVMPAIDVLYKMLYDLETDPTIGLVTGVYTTKTSPPSPHIYKRPNEGHYWGFSLDPNDPPEDIWGCGAGAMMVRVEAIKKARVPYWAEQASMDRYNQAYDITGHDIRFCELIREAGYRTCVDGSLLCAHIDNDGMMYRIPLDSPPVIKFSRNPNTPQYWNRVWGVETWGNPRVYHKLYRAILDIIPSECRVVDLGAGTGVLLQMLINFNRVHAKGYDFSDTSVSFMQERGINAEVLDLVSLELEHIVHTDMIVCTEVLEHVDESVMHHILKIIGTTNRVGIISVPTELVQSMEHLRSFTPESFQSLLENYFSRIEITLIEDRLLAVVRNTGVENSSSISKEL